MSLFPDHQKNILLNDFSIWGDSKDYVDDVQ